LRCQKWNSGGPAPCPLSTSAVGPAPCRLQCDHLPVADPGGERISVQNRRFRSNGARSTQNFRSPPPTKHSSCHKTRVNDLSCGIRMWAQLSFVLSQMTRMTERLPDSILIARPRPCSISVVKRLQFVRRL